MERKLDEIKQSIDKQEILSKIIKFAEDIMKTRHKNIDYNDIIVDGDKEFDLLTVSIKDDIFALIIWDKNELDNTITIILRKDNIDIAKIHLFQNNDVINYAAIETATAEHLTSKKVYELFETIYHGILNLANQECIE